MCGGVAWIALLKPCRACRKSWEKILDKNPGQKSWKKTPAKKLLQKNSCRKTPAEKLPSSTR
jgi:hypothetical protein